ncbi:MAG: hypothetical protein ACI841_002897 [Planctomycetota bacterium]|jgi:hypothetical protein
MNGDGLLDVILSYLSHKRAGIAILLREAAQTLLQDPSHRIASDPIALPTARRLVSTYISDLQ